MDKLIVRPSKDVTVLKEGGPHALPEGYSLVPNTHYYRSAIRDGDLVQGKRRDIKRPRTATPEKAPRAK